MTLSGVRVSAVALVLGVCLAGTVDAFGNYARGEAFVPLSGGLPSLGLRLTRGGAASCMMMASKKERVAGIRMDRKDGGGGKISKPGQGGGINKPGAAPGAGGGEGERERGGAGVAVLTKPPELDKVRPHPACMASDRNSLWPDGPLASKWSTRRMKHPDGARKNTGPPIQSCNACLVFFIFHKKWMQDGCTCRSERAVKQQHCA